MQQSKSHSHQVATATVPLMLENDSNTINEIQLQTSSIRISVKSKTDAGFQVIDTTHRRVMGANMAIRMVFEVITADC